MLTRRIVMATLVTMLISTLSAAPAAAAKPVKRPPPTTPERPLTPDEQAQADAKVAAANAYLASVAASGTDLVSLSCVTPTATTEPAGEDISSVGGIEPQGCYVPQGFLTVYARDQLFGHYCGPATGQVISNYAWAVASGANKYRQQDIAAWMGTDVNGATNAYSLEAGLERATGGAPRRPASWNWVVQPVGDFNGNGDTGDELFSFLRTNISGSAMPLAIPVKPHDPGAAYWLASWPRAVVSVGHWVAAYGWVGIYTKGSGYARLYFADSSKDEGGSTGKYYNSVLSVAWMMNHHTGRLVW